MVNSERMFHQVNWFPKFHAILPYNNLLSIFFFAEFEKELKLELAKAEAAAAAAAEQVKTQQLQQEQVQGVETDAKNYETHTSATENGFPQNPNFPKKCVRSFSNKFESIQKMCFCFCWSSIQMTYGRRIGKIPSRCRSGYTMDKVLGICLSNCKSGYRSDAWDRWSNIKNKNKNQKLGISGAKYFLPWSFGGILPNAQDPNLSP